jgi:beta-mannosidase
MMKTENQYSSSFIDLCGQWNLAWTEQPPQSVSTRVEAEAAGLDFYPCTVPGNFELDLFALGKLPDPFFGMNPVEVRGATEKCHVYYTRSFKAGNLPGAAPVLVFEGLDCFADVFVNGTLAASYGNMLIEHELELGGLLLEGENELFIHIRPAVAEALKYEYPQLISSLAVNYESIYVRKAPHMYGWDIMPRFVTAGLYRPVSVEYRPAEGIEELYLKTTKLSEDHSKARLMLHYKLKANLDGDYTVKITMAHGESVAEAQSKAHFIAGKVTVEITNPDLWWPRGRGEASQYKGEGSLYKNGSRIDLRRFRHGIRTVELRRTSLTTSTGEGEFVFIVNGEKVFMKGTNWVPADAFHSRDKERIPAILELVNDLNCNMVRCWGGNVYEDELFYDICDRSGILVWQDFAMACSIYPQDSGFAETIAKEAAAVVKRLRHHACVALWSGDNECDESYLWGEAHTDPNTNILTRKVLPEAVRLHDGTRPYISSSPFFDVGTLDKGEDYLPERHLWGPRDYFKSKFYTTALCHFVSEIGYHGCPAPQSVAKFISADKLWPCMGNDEWLLHSTSPVPQAHAYDYRVELMCKQIAELFTALPDGLADFAFASQVVQAEAMKFFIELFRMAKWRRTGILWWNVMDGWPQFSDAVVDYYFKKKLAYGFIKNSQQDVCVMMDEPESWYQKVVIANDTRLDKTIHCQIRDIDTGDMVFAGTYTAAADKSTVVGQVPYVRNKQRFFVISWQGDATGQNHYLAGQPPFDQACYKSWLERSGLVSEYLKDF